MRCHLWAEASGSHVFPLCFSFPCSSFLGNPGFQVNQLRDGRVSVHPASRVRNQPQLLQAIVILRLICTPAEPSLFYFIHSNHPFLLCFRRLHVWLDTSLPKMKTFSQPPGRLREASCLKSNQWNVCCSFCSSSLTSSLFCHLECGCCHVRQEATYEAATLEAARGPAQHGRLHSPDCLPRHLCE